MNEKRKKSLLKIAIAITVVLLLAGAFIIASLPAANVRVTEAEMEQAVKTNGGLIVREVTISKGDTFTINLFAAGYAGMRWTGNSDNIEIVRQDGAPTGGRDREKWTFKALGPGQAIISMSYNSVGVFETPRPTVNSLKIYVTVSE